jgi:hypothetical protein
VLLGDDLYGDAVLPLLMTQLAQVLLTLLVINLWEETVWTGVARKRLEQRHNLQVPLAEDQHPVGGLGLHCQDEALGEAVCPRTPRRDLDHLDARVR